MPTNANAYNSRITDEALEKRFRDAFRSQGGAELVDDLYASGVVVPVVDFTAAAEGSALRSDLQIAWDFATGLSTVANTTTTIVSTPGFWKIDAAATWNPQNQASPATPIFLSITDGLTSKKIWGVSAGTQAISASVAATDDQFVVFLRSGDSLTATTDADRNVLTVSYRQIADVSGNLTNPTGFTSS